MKLRITLVSGKINRTIKFAKSVALKEGKAELVQYRGRIWIRAEGSNRGKSIYVDMIVLFEEKLNAQEKIFYHRLEIIKVDNGV